MTSLTHRAPNLQLQQAWVEWLSSIQWEWFCTLTFRCGCGVGHTKGDPRPCRKPRGVHPEAAGKAFRYWANKLSRSIYGNNFKRRGTGVRWVRALEHHKSGLLHFHAIVEGVGDTRRDHWKGQWHERWGFARIDQVRSSEAVRKYVSKYLAKDGELDVGGPWEGRAVGQYRLLDAVSTRARGQREGTGACAARDERAVAASLATT